MRSKIGWISVKKIEGFVILDDGAYEWHRHGFDKHLVKTDFCTGGLREEDADKAIKILNKKRLFSFFKNTKGELTDGYK